ncbi:MAG: LysM peptidoglycan-binding domain-containing protein [Deltaproteobacteria bacterium]|nr:LysM peptidoglycan-binding domain-containing protein [Deltaproteobacteria bacterium]
MRNFLRWPLLLVIGTLVCLSPTAGAQDDEVIAPEERETIDAVEEEKPQPVIQDGRTQIEEEHTVVPGDTLWDLCGKYLNNPWYWPRVWSYNAEIHNPHWIFPGQLVRFYPTGELPGELLASRDFEVPEPYEEDMESEEIPPGLVVLTSPIISAKTVTAVMLNRDAFITLDEVDELGTISGSREDKDFLSDYDPIYLKFKNPGEAQVGKNFMIIRKIRKITHPITGEFRGHYTRVLGAAQIVSVHDKLATAIITASLMVIERGDLIAPWMSELSKHVAPKANSVELKGYIMDSRVTLTDLGERHIVFIDQGTDQGVEEGNVFDVVRREDGHLELGENREINFWDKDLPIEIFGRIMIVDARSQASTGMVMASLRELKVGDRVLMSVQ